MAPASAHPDALAQLDEIKAPAGVVLPPKEIKGLSLRATDIWYMLTSSQLS